MLTDLRFQNFKSWRDTGPIRLAPLTGFFGPNSSGKSAILHLLLVLKQTVESSDRMRVFHTGNEYTYVDLGTPQEVVHGYSLPAVIEYALSWQVPQKIEIPAGYDDSSGSKLRFNASIAIDQDTVAVQQLGYRFPDQQDTPAIEMRRIGTSSEYAVSLLRGLNTADNGPAQVERVGSPFKSYGFPLEANGNVSQEFVTHFEHLMHRIFYLGPLRVYPHRSYRWTGERPQDVGRRGEWAIPALLAAQKHGLRGSQGNGQQPPIEEYVAHWLRELGLVHSFRLQQIAAHRQDYEVRVRLAEDAPEVLITDVGFGVSQILPVLVLCYYVPEGSIILLEQPELHLHPAVQTGLADVLIDAIKTRNVQVVVESHSEHLLNRFQRRIAEEEILNTDTAFYFCEMGKKGVSQLTPLMVNEFGSISNWPHNFFGNEMGDLIAAGEAEMRRKNLL